MCEGVCARVCVCVCVCVCVRVCVCVCVKSVCRTYVQTSTDGIFMPVPPVDFARSSLARMPHGQCPQTCVSAIADSHARRSRPATATGCPLLRGALPKAGSMYVIDPGC